MKLRTKKVSAVLIGLAMVAGISACSAGSSSDTGSKGNVTLDWGFWDQGKQGNPIWEGLAADVHKKYPNITVKLTNPPFAAYFTKLQSQLAAGNTPCILSMQSLRLPGFAKAMVPLGDLMKQVGFKESDWNPAALKALQSGGKQYAIPYGFDTMVLYYNKDAFAQAGVPEPKQGWTTAEFEDAAKKITAATGKPAFGQSFSDLHMFSMLHAYNGANPVSSAGKLQLTNEKMQQAFTWYSGLATKEKVASVPASASDVPWGEQQFTAGNVAMAVDGTWNLSSNATDAKFNVGVVELPQGPNGGGSYSANSGFGISQTCTHKKEAAEAISVLTGEAGASAAAQAGNTPARTAQDSTFFAALGKVVDSKTPGFSKQVEETMKATAAVAVPFLSTDSWDQTTKQIARQFILAYTGSQSPDASLKNVQQSAH